ADPRDDLAGPFACRTFAALATPRSGAVGAQRLAGSRRPRRRFVAGLHPLESLAFAIAHATPPPGRGNAERSAIIPRGRWAHGARSARPNAAPTLISARTRGKPQVRRGLAGNDRAGMADHRCRQPVPDEGGRLRGAPEETRGKIAGVESVARRRRVDRGGALGNGDVPPLLPVHDEAAVHPPLHRRLE